MNLPNIIKTLILTIITAIVNIIVVIGMPLIFDNFTLGNWYNAIFITIGVAIANMLIWPILSRFLMKFIIYTFGVGALIINSANFY